MITLLIPIAIVFVLYTMYVVQIILRAQMIGKELVKKARAYTSNDVSHTHSMLVLGDSTAVGTGSEPEKSVPGRFAEYFNATVENYAVNGATTHDLFQQSKQARKDHYDMIEIHIGANDVIGFHSLKSAARDLDTVLTDLRGKSNSIVLLTAGNIGNAPVFVWPLNILVSYRTRILRRLFKVVCADHHVVYVDIFAEPDIFVGQEKRFYAPDGLHLTGEGYGYWFQIVRKYVNAQQS